MRRFVVSPTQLGGTWRNVPGSDGLPGSERTAGDNSMPGNRRAVPRCTGRTAGGPAAIWRKLDCLNPSPQRWNCTLFGTTFITRCHRHAWNRVSSRLRSGRWAMRSERIQGDERDAYVVLTRSLMTHHGMAYGARALWSRSRRSSRGSHAPPGSARRSRTRRRAAGNQMNNHR